MIPCVLPLRHAYGLMLTSAFLYGGDTVIMHEKVDIKTIYGVQTFKATIFFMVG